jgi:hypothetical protein
MQGITNGVRANRALNGNRPKEIAYVEDQLDLPGVWASLDQATGEINSLLNRKSIQLMSIAAHDEKVLSHEHDLQAATYSDPDFFALSVAAQEREMKRRFLLDGEMQSLLAQQRSLKAELEQIEVDLRSNEIAHRAYVARLNSISEYLRYLTSARDARTVMESQLPY